MNAVQPWPDLLPLVDAALRGALLAFLLLLAIRQGDPRRPFGPPGLGRALCAGLAVQVVASTPVLEACLPWRWQAPLIGISVGNAVLFWLFARALFEDEFRPRRRHLLAWAAAVLLGSARCALYNGPPTLAPLLPSVSLGQRLLPLVLGAHVGLRCLWQWRDDLVEARRRLRAWVCLGGAGYSLLMVWVRLRSDPGRLEGGGALLDMSLLLLVCGVVGLRSLVPDALAPLPQVPAAPAEPSDAASMVPAAGRSEPASDDAEQLQRLLALMRGQRPYLDEGFTLSRLAELCALPEYRLRRLINQGLGHRNFTAFANEFRLDDARRALADPLKAREPVLAIAMAAGFQSIGPFNRAFKARWALTPSEFRRASLAESLNPR